jgi:hypothetical protein
MEFKRKFQQYFSYTYIEVDKTGVPGVPPTCVFANILLISFIFNNKFMFCICFIIIIDHIFVDFSHGDHGDVENQGKETNI